MGLLHGFHMHIIRSIIDYNCWIVLKKPTLKTIILSHECDLFDFQMVQCVARSPLKKSHTPYEAVYHFFLNPSWLASKSQTWFWRRIHIAFFENKWKFGEVQRNEVKMHTPIKFVTTECHASSYLLTHELKSFPTVL